jgi:hypothetical protein
LRALCGLRLASGPRFSRRLRIFRCLLIAPSGFFFGGRQRLIARNRAGVRRSRLTRSTRAYVRFRCLACSLCRLRFSSARGFGRGVQRSVTRDSHTTRRRRR